MYAEMLVAGLRSSATGAIPQRGSKDGHQVVMQGHARFLQAVLDGNVYSGSNPAGTAVTTQAGLSATTPALTLYNPIGSQKLLVMWSCNVIITASPAAACGLMLAANSPAAAAPTSVTAGVVQNALLHSTQTGVGLCYRVATLAAAPVAVRYMGGVTGASAIGGVVLQDFIDGQLVVGPGVALSIQATSAAAIIAQFIWEEIPLSMAS